MIGKSLILFCVTIGLVAGTCLEVPQCGSSILSSGYLGGQVVSTPVVAENVYGSGVYGSGLYGSGLLSSGVVGGIDALGVVGGVGALGAVATNGPETAPLPVVQAPSVTLPTVEAPVVALPSAPIPAPRVISQRCVCTKTVVKPQVIQRQVTVPKVQRYLKRTVTPIVENVTFKSRPVSGRQSVYGSSVVAPAVGSGAVAYQSGNCYSRVC